MPLWILRLIPPLDAGPFDHSDTAQGFVVRAADAASARLLVIERPYGDTGIMGEAFGREGASAWADPRITSCERLMEFGHDAIILRDYHHG